MMLFAPSPNQMRAIGRSAIEGSGLNIDVRISSKSAPIRVTLAKAVKSPAKKSPADGGGLGDIKEEIYR